MKRIECKGNWEEKIQDFLYNIDRTEVLYGWVSDVDIETRHREWEFESPDIAPFEIIVPKFPVQDPFEPEDEISDIRDLMRLVRSIYEEEETVKHDEAWDVRLVPSFMIIQDYGSDFKRDPFEILVVNSAWEEWEGSPVNR